MKWEFIETAPRDGTVILGFDPAWYNIATPIKFDVRFGKFVFFHIPNEEIRATHWMPMPELPTKDSPK